MRKILNIEYGFIHAYYWMYYGIVGSFASVFLSDKGYSSGDIGSILGIGCVLAIILQPFIADMGDRSKRISVFGIAQVIGFVMLIGTLGIFIFDRRSLALSVIFVGLIAWVTALQPLFNYMAFKISTSGYHVNFGLARSGGSLGYSLICMILGYLVEAFGVRTIPIAGMAVLLLLLIVIWHLRRNYIKACKITGKGSLLNVKADNRFENSDAKESVGEDFGPGEVQIPVDVHTDEITLSKFIGKNKLFFILNIAVVFIFFNNGVLNSFLYQIVGNAGGTSGDMGAIFSIMAFCEIPTLVFFDKILEKVSCSTLMKIACVAFTLKILTFYIAGSTTLMFVAQVFQPFAFATFLPAMIHFTDQVMEPGESVKGQALFTIMMALSTVVASVLGGYIIDFMGVKALLLVSVAMSVVGAVILFCYIGKVHYRKEC
ncbi:MAG: MFS transporter [Clostridiales bacterium]|nr:MFS transporter [Clostridiales bacterium]MDD7347526.1 MFS transporter [Clostridiales bacterium]MDY4060935.1 MFS transporter [Anaerovoracaceae bacterium]